MDKEGIFFGAESKRTSASLGIGGFRINPGGELPGDHRFYQTE